MGLKIAFLGHGITMHHAFSSESYGPSKGLKHLENKQIAKRRSHLSAKKIQELREPVFMILFPVQVAGSSENTEVCKLTASAQRFLLESGHARRDVAGKSHQIQKTRGEDQPQNDCHFKDLFQHLGMVLSCFKAPREWM